MSAPLQPQSQNGKYLSLSHTQGEQHPADPSATPTTNVFAEKGSVRPKGRKTDEVGSSLRPDVRRLSQDC